MSAMEQAEALQEVARAPEFFQEVAALERYIRRLPLDPHRQALLLAALVAEALSEAERAIRRADMEDYQ